jgi:DNA replication and repair protein RecF
MFNYHITRVFFQNIRNFDSYSLDVQNGKSLILIGDNGIGKTSILEAISLIYGRGIRGAKYAEISNTASINQDWFSSVIISDSSYSNKISAEYQNGKKTIRINDKIAKNFNTVLEYIRMFWVTQDDYHNFLLSASYRRKFLDRMIIQIIPNYYDYLTQYQHYISERSKVLATIGCIDDIWLNELESKIAKLNIVIKNSRNAVVNDFNEFTPSDDEDSWKFFPKIKITGLLEEKFFFEEEILNFLKMNRGLHTKMKRINIGVHLSKVNLFDYNKDFSIDFFSSGEQRLLLNKFIINFTKMQSAKENFKPILLLDDILTFFDETNQNLLVEELLKLETQFFITTNNMKLRDDVLSSLCVRETFKE